MTRMGHLKMPEIPTGLQKAQMAKRRGEFENKKSDDQREPPHNSPSIFPCSQSTTTQSTPVLARLRLTFAPGIICQHPIEGPLPSSKATLNLFAAFMDAMLKDLLLEPIRSLLL
jgi:hypothetical protein